MGEAGHEVAFVQHVAGDRRGIGAGLAQLGGQRIQPRLRPFPRTRFAWIGVHDQIETALEVVEDRDFLRQHQQDVGRTEFVRLVARGQARLDVADALEAEPAHQAAGEPWQVRQARHRIRRAQRLDFGERVFDLACLDQLALVTDFQAMAMEGDHAPHRQADDGVATEAFAAFHRFEQVGVRRVGKLQVDRERRVQVGQHFTDNGDAIEAFSSELLERVVRDQAGFPSGTRWRGGRRLRATIASCGVRKIGKAGAWGGTRRYSTRCGRRPTTMRMVSGATGTPGAGASARARPRSRRGSGGRPPARHPG